MYPVVSCVPFNAHDLRHTNHVSRGHAYGSYGFVKEFERTLRTQLSSFRGSRKIDGL